MMEVVTWATSQNKYNTNSLIPLESHSFDGKLSGFDWRINSRPNSPPVDMINASICETLYRKSEGDFYVKCKGKSQYRRGEMLLYYWLQSVTHSSVLLSNSFPPNLIYHPLINPSINWWNLISFKLHPEPTQYKGINCNCHRRAPNPTVALRSVTDKRYPTSILIELKG